MGKSYSGKSKSYDKRLIENRKPLTKEERSEINRKNALKANKLPRNKVHPKADPLPDIPNNEYDMLADIYSPKARYEPEIKIAAVAAFVATGTVRGTARATGLSKQCISEWKNKSQWWPGVYQKIKKDKQEELDARLTTLIHKAFDEMEDRLINGDEVITKDGDKERKKISARDLSMVGGIMYDKRAMLRGDPTSISAKASPQEILSSLKEELTAIAKAELNKTVVNPEIDDAKSNNSST